MNNTITPMEWLLIRHRGWPTQPNPETVVQFIRAKEAVAEQCSELLQNVSVIALCQQQSI